MKILHVLPRFVAPDLIPNLERMGGAERYAISFCRAQRKIGLDSSVLLFSEKESISEVDGVPILTAKAWRFFRMATQNKCGKKRLNSAMKHQICEWPVSFLSECGNANITKSRRETVV